MLVLGLVLASFVVHGGLFRVVIGALFKKYNPYRFTLRDELDFASMRVLSFKYLWVLQLLEPYILYGLYSCYYFFTSTPAVSTAPQHTISSVMLEAEQPVLPAAPHPVYGAVPNKCVPATLHPVFQSARHALQGNSYVPVTYTDHLFNGMHWAPEECGSRLHPRALIFDNLVSDPWARNLHTLDMSRFDFNMRAYITAQTVNIRPVDSFQQPYHVYIPEGPMSRIRPAMPLDPNIRFAAWPAEWIQNLPSFEDRYVANTINYYRSIITPTALQMLSVDVALEDPSRNHWVQGLNRANYGLAVNFDLPAVDRLRLFNLLPFDPHGLPEP